MKLLGKELVVVIPGVPYLRTRIIAETDLPSESYTTIRNGADIARGGEYARVLSIAPPSDDFVVVKP
jgi:hypothetical protein